MVAGGTVQWIGAKAAHRCSRGGGSSFSLPASTASHPDGQIFGCHRLCQPFSCMTRFRKQTTPILGKVWVLQGARRSWRLCSVSWWIFWHLCLGASKLTWDERVDSDRM